MASDQSSPLSFSNTSKAMNDDDILELIANRGSVLTADFAKLIQKPAAAANSILSSLLRRGKLDSVRADGGLTWKIGSGESDPKTAKPGTVQKPPTGSKSRIWVSDENSCFYVYSKATTVEDAEKDAEDQGHKPMFAELL